MITTVKNSSAIFNPALIPALSAGEEPDLFTFRTGPGQPAALIAGGLVAEPRGAYREHGWADTCGHRLWRVDGQLLGGRRAHGVHRAMGHRWRPVKRRGTGSAIAAFALPPFEEGQKIHPTNSIGSGLYIREGSEGREQAIAFLNSMFIKTEGRIALLNAGTNPVGPLKPARALAELSPLAHAIWTISQPRCKAPGPKPKKPEKSRCRVASRTNNTALLLLTAAS